MLRRKKVKGAEMTLAIGNPVADATGFVVRGSDAFCRVLDVVAALALVLLFAPVLLLVALAVKLSSPGPMIFGHLRVGRNGETFRCLKFRTMVCDAEDRLAELLRIDPEARAEWARSHKLKNDPRITTVGNFLRRSSLDELPQLFNVLSGRMSLVGPRPIVLAEAQRYGRYYREYCQVRPGLTGLWQISGRSDVSYRRRIALDVAFIRARDVRLYCWVLIATVPSVLLSRGSC